MPTAASSNNTDVQVMLNSAGWVVLRDHLLAKRAELLELLLKQESEAVRGQIKGIDLVFAEILSIKNASTLEKFEPDI